MTSKQRIFLMADLWPAACRAQGWTPNDRARRIAVISQALGRFVTSASEIRSNDDFDKVKQHLKILADDLRAAGEADSEGRARRLRHKILLALGALARELGPEAAEHYAAAIIRDKFNHGRSAAVEIVALEDLTAAPVNGGPSQLDQLLITLTDRTLELTRAHAREHARMAA